MPDVPRFLTALESPSKLPPPAWDTHCPRPSSLGPVLSSRATKSGRRPRRSEPRAGDGNRDCRTFVTDAKPGHASNFCVSSFGLH